MKSFYFIQLSTIVNPILERPEYFLQTILYEPSKG